MYLILTLYIPRIMVDLNALLTPSMSNLISPWSMSIALTILMNDLPRMNGDEVDLFSILEVEFVLEIQRSSASGFRSCVARYLCLQNFSRPSTKYIFFVGDVSVHLRLGLANINKKGTKR
jgi:hypothetical protein